MRKCLERMASSGDALGLRFSRQLTAAGSRWPCPEISQQRPAAIAGSAAAAAAASIGIATHCPSRLRKAQTRRTHTISSEGTTSESALNVSAARNSRQTYTHRTPRSATMTLARTCTTMYSTLMSGGCLQSRELLTARPTREGLRRGTRGGDAPMRE